MTASELLLQFQADVLGRAGRPPDGDGDDLPRRRLRGRPGGRLLARPRRAAGQWTPDRTWKPSMAADVRDREARVGQGGRPYPGLDRRGLDVAACCQHLDPDDVEALVAHVHAEPVAVHVLECRSGQRITGCVDRRRHPPRPCLGASPRRLRPGGGPRHRRRLLRPGRPQPAPGRRRSATPASRWRTCRGRRPTRPRSTPGTPSTSTRTPSRRWPACTTRSRPGRKRHVRRGPVGTADA